MKMRAHAGTSSIRWLTAVCLSGAFACLSPRTVGGGLSDLNLDKFKKAAEQGKKAVDAVRPMTPNEELTLGETVGRRLKSNYGVVDSEAIQRYVTLVGMTVARHVPPREGVQYRFVVLDTNLVNAFSVPGGDIYVTKGLLRAVSNEAQLAGVLGHELHHAAARHPAKAVEKSKRGGAIGEASLESQPELLKAATTAATEVVLAGYGRTEESESDVAGLDAAVESGYEPGGLVEFLTILRAEKKKEDPGKTNNGLLGSHPEVSARIQRLQQKIEKDKIPGGARLADRYSGTVPFASPDESLAHLQGRSGAEKGDDAGEEGAKDEKSGKKKGFNLSGLKNLGTSLTSHTGGAADASDDRAATGGVRGVDQEVVKSDGQVAYQDPNIKVTKEQLAAFIKEGRLK